MDNEHKILSLYLADDVIRCHALWCRKQDKQNCLRYLNLCRGDPATPGELGMRPKTLPDTEQCPKIIKWEA